MSMLDVRAPARRLDSTDPDQMMGTRAVATRYDIAMRTLDRWLERPNLEFPRPALVVGIRRYWRPSDLIAWELAQGIPAAGLSKTRPVNKGGAARALKIP